MFQHDFATFDAWHLKAEEDFTAASILTDHHGPAATICFLCQQTAERYLKGYILLNQGTPRRIHHLDVLLEGCIVVAEQLVRRDVERIRHGFEGAPEYTCRLA